MSGEGKNANVKRKRKKAPNPIVFLTGFCLILLTVFSAVFFLPGFIGGLLTQDGRGSDLQQNVASQNENQAEEIDDSLVNAQYESSDLSVQEIDFTPGVFSLEGLFESTVLNQSDIADDDYINDIVFVGESTTYGLYHYEILPKGHESRQVWTPTSGTLMLTNANSDMGKVNVVNPNSGEREDLLIKDAAELYKPKYMIITLGLNGLSFYIDEDTDYYIGEYVNLISSIKEVSPDTKIMVQSLFPVASNYEYIKSISNERINKANYLFAQMCETLEIKFLNTAPIFMDEKGNMDQRFHNGDGLHLSEEALKMEIDFIKSHKYE